MTSRRKWTARIVSLPGIKGAIKRRIINGLITDKLTAEALLGKDLR